MKQINKVPVQENGRPEGDSGIRLEQYEKPAVRKIELAAYEILGSCTLVEDASCIG